MDVDKSELAKRAIAPFIGSAKHLARTFLLCLLFTGASLASPKEPPELITAALKNDIDRIRTLLSMGHDPNATDEYGCTAIYFSSSPEIVDLLLDRGAKLDVRSSFTPSRSPLETASENAYYEEGHQGNWRIIADKLRAAGAPYTITAAIYLNDLQFMNQQLESDSVAVDRCEESLRLAASTGRVEICRLFLERGADPNQFEKGAGFPIIVDAVTHPAVLRLLIAHGANLKRRITWTGGGSGIWILGDECTALHHAVAAGNLESIKTLVRAGLDPNATDTKGQTPLHVAIQFDLRDPSLEDRSAVFIEVVNYLLKNEASLLLTDGFDRTPAELAEQDGCSEEIRTALRMEQEERDQKYHEAWFGKK